MSNSSTKTSTIWTPANIVTIVRILLVPVFVAVLIAPWPQWVTFWPEAELYKPWIAGFLFSILAATDALDGYLARSRGEVTDFGKFIDPLADKILVAGALLALCELQVLPSWVALIILVREFIVSGLRMVAASQGIVVAASWYGKAKTVFQIIAILLFIIMDSELLVSIHESMSTIFFYLSWSVMAIALILTIVSMLDYLFKCKEVLGFKPADTSDDFYITKHDTVGEKVENNTTTEESAKGVSGINSASSESSGANTNLSAPDASVIPTGHTEHEITDEVIEAAQEVIALAQQKKTTLSTAESCTGGLIAGSLTAIPGSSEVVWGGVVSYSNEVKESVLKVSSEDLRNYGAVSSQVACAMAEGSRKLCGSDIAVSVTGVAGPGGGSPEKPVGTVWFGVSTQNATYAEVCHFGTDRTENRTKTILHALSLMKKEIQK
ncbi:MAG: CDP-diacylglycerol--glycerol-3-phosphate 3-phosphatidyltransferase [Anaerotardibacter sp.]